MSLRINPPVVEVHEGAGVAEAVVGGTGQAVDGLAEGVKTLALTKRYMTPEQFAVMYYQLGVTESYMHTWMKRLGFEIVILPAATVSPSVFWFNHAKGVLRWLESPAGQAWLAERDKEEQIEWLRDGKRTLAQLRRLLKRPGLLASLMEEYVQVKTSPV